MNHRLHDRQFPDEIDEAVELTRVDLDGRLTRSALESEPASALRRFPGIVGMWRWRKLLIGRRGFAEVIQSGDEDRTAIVKIAAIMPGQATLDVAHHAGQQIDRRENELDLGTANAMLPETSAIQQILDPVRELFDAGEAQRARTCLDGVERPKHVVERLPVLGRRLKRQDARLKRAEVIECLGEENGGEFGVGFKSSQIGIGHERTPSYQNLPYVPVSPNAARSSAEAL